MSDRMYRYYFGVGKSADQIIDGDVLLEYARRSCRKHNNLAISEGKPYKIFIFKDTMYGDFEDDLLFTGDIVRQMGVEYIGSLEENEHWDLQFNKAYALYTPYVGPADSDSVSRFWTDNFQKALEKCRKQDGTFVVCMHGVWYGPISELTTMKSSAIRLIHGVTYYTKNGDIISRGELDAIGEKMREEWLEICASVME